MGDCVGDLFLSLIFFFFKQKTAYEMRISDWSSDVCSSDLANFSGERLDGTVGVHRHDSADGGRMHGHFFGQSSFATYALTTERNTVKVPDDVRLELLGPLGCGKIGRASCRARVGKYV